MNSPLRYRQANPNDASLLAAMNQRLIEDEGHRGEAIADDRAGADAALQHHEMGERGRQDTRVADAVVGEQGGDRFGLRGDRALRGDMDAGHGSPS